MKLHVLPISANSHGCLAVVKHLKLDESDVEIVDAMGKTRTPEFLAINPCHTCPTLEFDGDNNGAIWESCAVLRCLCMSFPGGEELYPTDPMMRGKIDMVMDWKNTSLYPDMFHIAYGPFGVTTDEELAKINFAKILDVYFPLLVDVFLKDTKFCFSDTPTIADLAVAPLVTLFKCREKFWAKVPHEVKEYYGRVLDAFPDVKEYVNMLDDMMVSYDGPGANAEP